MQTFSVLGDLSLSWTVPHTLGAEKVKTIAIITEHQIVFISSKTGTHIIYLFLSRHILLRLAERPTEGCEELASGKAYVFCSLLKDTISFI